MFSLRRRTDHGIGDVTALREWIDWAAESGVGFIQLLPINALGSDDVPSPYSAISSVALEPLYLSLEPWLIPGMPERVTFNMEGIPGKRYPGVENLVDFPRVRAWKRWVLGRSWLRFREKPEFEQLREEFKQWSLEEESWLENYVCYVVLSALFNSDCWWQWPEQDPQRARAIAAAHEPIKDYHRWLQWLCFRQWTHLRRYANSRGVALMGDIPIGVSMASADVFFERHLFDTNWCGGAPAEGEYADDPFTAKWGQNWGIPLYRWDVMAQDNYAWWRRRISYSSLIFSVYRIDHILGFYRIYAFPWMPTENDRYLHLSREEAYRQAGGRSPQFLPRDDHSPINRKHNLMDGDLYLRIILSVVPGIRVVGEDLGYVPDYVRPNMRQLGIAGFKIPHWEIQENGDIIKGDLYHPCSFAVYSTHDMPPIMQTWNHCYADVEKAKKAGYLLTCGVKLKSIPKDKKDIIYRNAENSLRVLKWFASYCSKPLKSMLKEWDDEIKSAMYKALFLANSDYAALMWTELFDVPERLNIPGTVGGINWRWRMTFNAYDAIDMPQSKWLKGMMEQAERKGVFEEQEAEKLNVAAMPFPQLMKSRENILEFFMLNPFGRSM